MFHLMQEDIGYWRVDGVEDLLNISHHVLPYPLFCLATRTFNFVPKCFLFDPLLRFGAVILSKPPQMQRQLTRLSDDLMKDSNNALPGQADYLDFVVDNISKLPISSKSMAAFNLGGLLGGGGRHVFDG